MFSAMTSAGQGPQPGLVSIPRNLMRDSAALDEEWVYLAFGQLAGALRIAGGSALDDAQLQNCCQLLQAELDMHAEFEERAKLQKQAKLNEDAKLDGRAKSDEDAKLLQAKLNEHAKLQAKLNEHAKLDEQQAILASLGAGHQQLDEQAKLNDNRHSPEIVDLKLLHQARFLTRPCRDQRPGVRTRSAPSQFFFHAISTNTL